MDNIENNHHSRDWSINPSSPSSSSDSAKRIANDEILLEDIEKEFIIIAPEKDETPEWTVLIHKNDYQDILLRIGLEIEKQEMQAMNTPTPGTRASFLDTATRSSIETTKAEAASGWGGGPPPRRRPALPDFDGGGPRKTLLWHSLLVSAPLRGGVPGFWP